MILLHSNTIITRLNTLQQINCGGRLEENLGSLPQKPLLVVPVTASHYWRTEISASAAVITQARNHKLERKETVFIVLGFGRAQK